MNNQPLIHIVIPLYNEEKILAKSVDTLINFLSQTRFPYQYQITLVNNASTDRSAVVCAFLEAQWPQVKSLHLDRKGKGHAIRSGWNLGVGDVFAFMDVDLASDLRFFRPLIDGILVAKHDLVVGSRLGPNSRIIGRRTHREVISRVYNWMIRSLFRSHLPDHQCGFKAIHKDAYALICRHLEDSAWFIDTELIVWSLRNGLKVHPVDIVWTDQTDSKVSIPRTSLQLFRSALALKKKVRMHSKLTGNQR
jgi:glycosyltransferase involved in cell wall biosynthesis